MTRSTITLFVAFFSGFLFSVGLAIAGMTQPQNILNFLDITGKWDWRLLLVMGGGIAASLCAYGIKTNMKKPIFDSNFYVPLSKKISVRLLLGAAIFGIGWGLGGFCPGPAISSLASLHWQPAVFVVAMLTGMWLSKLVVTKES